MSAPTQGSERRGRITQASIDAVLHRSDIVDLVSGYTQLQKKGAEFSGRCPFHEERTPSFWVNPGKGVYHCFGCSQSGDVVNFVQHKQQLDFVEAIEFLADRYRVQLEYEGGDAGAGERRASKRRLYELMESATSFYEAFLWKSGEAAPARAYLHARNVTEETARAFRLGFSPDSPGGTSKRALAKGFTRDELTQARLVGAKGGDFFRGRLMVPIVDRAERIVGFGARKLRDEQFGGKYVNSADGVLFHKKETVYLGPETREAAAKRDAVVVVEGYMDVIAMHQAGFRNVCAVMGTSLTEQQVVELKRLAPRAYFAFDPDTAGQVATLRALEKARTHDLDVRVTLLPDGDPADVVGEPDGRERMVELLEHSVPLLHYRVSALLGSHELGSAPGRTKAFEAARQLFADIPASPERSEQVRRVAGALQLDAQLTQALELGTSDGASLRDQAYGARQQRGGRATPQPGPRTSPTHPRDDAVVRSERLFLAIALRLAELGALHGMQAQVAASDLQLDVHRRAWEALGAGDPAALDVARIRDDTELVSLVAALGAHAERDQLPADAPQLTVMFAELALRLEAQRLDREIAAAKERYAQATDDESLAALTALQARRRDVRARLRDDAGD